MIVVYIWIAIRSLWSALTPTISLNPASHHVKYSIPIFQVSILRLRGANWVTQWESGRNKRDPQPFAYKPRAFPPHHSRFWGSGALWPITTHFTHGERFSSLKAEKTQYLDPPVRGVGVGAPGFWLGCAIAFNCRMAGCSVRALVVEETVGRLSISTDTPVQISYLQIWNPRSNICRFITDMRLFLWRLRCTAFLKPRKNLNPGTHPDPVISDVGLWVHFSILMAVLGLHAHQHHWHLFIQGLPCRVPMAPSSPFGPSPGPSNLPVGESLTSGNTLPFSLCPGLSPAAFEAFPALTLPA